MQREEHYLTDNKLCELKSNVSLGDYVSRSKESNIMYMGGPDMNRIDLVTDSDLIKLKLEIFERDGLINEFTEKLESKTKGI